MKTKPFNLKEALAGKGVVDGGGRAVTDLYWADSRSSDYKLIGVVSGARIGAWNDKGEFIGKTDGQLDLRMVVNTLEVSFFIDDPILNVSEVIDGERYRVWSYGGARFCDHDEVKSYFGSDGRVQNRVLIMNANDEFVEGHIIDAVGKAIAAQDKKRS